MNQFKKFLKELSIEKSKEFAKGREISNVFNKLRTDKETILSPSKNTLKKVAKELKIPITKVIKLLDVFASN